MSTPGKWQTGPQNGALYLVLRQMFRADAWTNQTHL